MVMVHSRLGNKPVSHSEERIQKPLFPKLVKTIRAIAHGGIIALSFSLILLQIILSSSVGVKGAEVKKLEEATDVLFQQKSDLENQIARLSSLNRIKAEASEKLSMIPAYNHTYYVTPEKMASVQ